MTKKSENSGSPGQYIHLHDHFHMLRDTARMQAFKEALQKVVPQGARVLELGGGTGVLSFFAAQRAAKVWCVEKIPELVRASRHMLSLNGIGEKIHVIEGDAMEYLPPEPVDVVICEMIHVGMLREKQIQVIHSFKERYRRKFGDQLPLFVPEAAIMAVQPVFQLFNFSGFYAPTPLFYDPMMSHNETLGMGDPWNYQMLMYNQDLPDQYRCDCAIPINVSGAVNALRFITKNVVAILVPEKRTIDWFSQYMVVPIPEPLNVKTGDQIHVRFSYQSGDPIDSLTKSISATRTCADASPVFQTLQAR